MPLFPALTTKSIARVGHGVVQRGRLVGDRRGRPQDALTMRTPNDSAYSIAAIACKSAPQKGESSMNLSAMILTDGATPTTPGPFE